MSKKIIFIIIIIILIIATISAGILLFLNQKKEDNKINYTIQEIDKYNYFVLKREDKYGVIDNKGNTIVDAKYDNLKIPNPTKDVFICYLGEDNTVVLNKENQKILTQYNEVEPVTMKNVATDLAYEKSILTYKENDRLGIIDFDGNKLTEAIYDSIENLTYREGQLLTRKDDKLGLININGYTIIENLYDEILSDTIVSEDKNEKLGYTVGNKTSDGIKYGYINNKGELKLQLEYNEILKLDNNNEDYVIARKNGQYGFIKNYENIIDFIYQDIEYYNDIKVLRLQKGTKYGVANLNGDIIIPIDFTELEIKGNYIYAKNDSENIVYNSKGEKQSIDFNTTISNTENENYKIQMNSQENRNVYGVIDEQGNQVIPNKYLYLEYAYRDYFIVCGENGKLGVVDKNDNIIVDLQYDLVQKINDKCAIQTLNVNSKVTSIYSSNMEKSLELTNANISIEDEYIKVYSEYDLKYLDNNGNIIESKDALKENTLFASKQNEKWGFVDSEGKFVIEPIYERVTDFNKYGYASIKLNNKWGSINENGKIIIEPKYEFNSDYSEIDFINRYYKKQFGFGEIYYTDM